MKKSIILFIIFIGLVCCTRNKDIDTPICFIGDSMVANWDVAHCFPNRMVENKGKDGIGIEDLDAISLSETMANLVVLIGTNDLNTPMTNEEFDSYATQYITSVCQLKADKCVLISILPTANVLKNQRIEYINKRICNDVSNLAAVKFVDCYDSFLHDGKIKEELTRDGTHLNDYGYMLLTDLIKEEL